MKFIPLFASLFFIPFLAACDDTERTLVHSESIPEFFLGTATFEVYEFSQESRQKKGARYAGNTDVSASFEFTEEGKARFAEIFDEKTSAFCRKKSLSRDYVLGPLGNSTKYAEFNCA